jgi:hypothetical protein
VIRAFQHSHNFAGRRALPALRRLAGCLVRVRQTILVCALCLVWNSPISSMAHGQVGRSPDAQQPIWHLGERTELQSWYWGEVPRAPKVTGGYSICAPIAGGQRCVLVAQGKYRLLTADGVIVENSGYKLRLLQVWR